MSDDLHDLLKEFLIECLDKWNVKLQQIPLYRTKWLVEMIDKGNQILKMINKKIK